MNENKIETITFADVLKDIQNPLIAFQHKKEKNKGFLMRESYHSMYYKAWSVHSFSLGNGWNTSLAKPVKYWFEWFEQKVEWYLFDTPQEMFAWLAE